MITQIGITAGDIWHYLDAHPEVSLSDIGKGIDKPEDIVLMSIGWLAREGHVVVEKVDGKYTVRVRKQT